ncbi:MAG: SMC family ATPase [Dehalococcoidia bacterium]
MRPRNLKLSGFTCFREPVEIDFRGMDVFVIAGPTGAGKTTIVDAICYALFGKVPRGTTVRDLIARDATEMKVQLEFDSGGRTFRVHRGVNVARTTNRKTGAEQVSRGPSPVQFERHVGGDEWEPLEDRVERIDAAIEGVVGLDFDSFTKCVLLPQGRFAEFLTGKPEERRKILIDLLDLGIYQAIMQEANRRAGTLAPQIAERERRLAEDYADATEERLAATREQFAAAKPLLDTEHQRRDALQRATEHTSAFLMARRQQKTHEDAHDAKTRELQVAEITAKDAETTLVALTDALAAAEAELARTTYDGTLHAALVRAESCARQVARARTAAESALAAASDRSTLEAAEVAASDAQAKHAAAREAIAAAEDVLREAQRADAAAHLRSGLKPGDPCPVCGGVIGKLPKAEKPALAATERAVKDARAAESSANTAASKAAAVFARAQEAFDGATHAAVIAQAEWDRSEEELRGALPGGESADITHITKRLADQEQARASHDDLSSNLERVRAALHEHHQQAAGSGRAIAALKAELSQVAASIASDRTEGDDALAQLKQIASTWQWGDVIELIDAKTSPADLLKDMLATSQRETEDLARRIATLDAAAQAIEKAIGKAADLRDELTGMKERHQLCRDLAVLLQANHFQQFVIVEAMQVLAEAATEHLRTLFDRFGIRVDGGEFAVVDHWHAEQVRPAKTLSGGETFVASLALALALAERLPQLRSAAASSLESLILDEGFGTLDTETLETVIEALEGLRSEERMVGVITHVPELTHRIEHRIMVRKSPAGSTVEVGGAVA